MSGTFFKMKYINWLSHIKLSNVEKVAYFYFSIFNFDDHWMIFHCSITLRGKCTSFAISGTNQFFSALCLSYWKGSQFIDLCLRQYLSRKKTVAGYGLPWVGGFPDGNFTEKRGFWPLLCQRIIHELGFFQRFSHSISHHDFIITFSASDAVCTPTTASQRSCWKDKSPCFHFVLHLLHCTHIMILRRERKKLISSNAPLLPSFVTSL